MFGFVLAIGIVVDDAIIVVEAVQHYIDEQHMSPKEATYKRHERDSRHRVIAIALILASVFVPVGFNTGYSWAVVSAICYNDSYICNFISIYSIIINTGIVYLVIEAFSSPKEKLA